MRVVARYVPEFLLIGAVMVTSTLGFWDIYFGSGADPQPHHHLHVLTTFVWLGLLMFQLALIGSGQFARHRKVGLLILAIGPLLFATTAMLAVHSAHRGLVSGNGDFLIVQNVLGVLELGLLIALAFILRKNRKLHASFLMSTTIPFLGISTFFALLTFVPAFRIEGPETFGRFETAALTGQTIGFVVAVVFFLRDIRHGWPFLLAGGFFFLNELIKAVLTNAGLIDPLTELVGSLSEPLTFAAAFAVLAFALLANGLLVVRRPTPT